jgi:hypothetical protein
MRNIKYLADGPVAAGTAYGALQSTVDFFADIEQALTDGRVEFALKLARLGRELATDAVEGCARDD